MISCMGLQRISLGTKACVCGGGGARACIPATQWGRCGAALEEEQ